MAPNHDEDGADTYADENVNDTQRGGRPCAAGVAFSAVGSGAAYDGEDVVAEPAGAVGARVGIGEGPGRAGAARQAKPFSKEKRRREAQAAEDGQDRAADARQEANEIDISNDSHEEKRADEGVAGGGQGATALFSPNRANIQASQNDRRAGASLSRKLKQTNVAKSSAEPAAGAGAGLTPPGMLRNEAHDYHAVVRAHVQSTSPVHSSHQIKTAFQAKDGINLKSRQAQIGDQGSIERLGRVGSGQGGAAGVHSFSST